MLKVNYYFKYLLLAVVSLASLYACKPKSEPSPKGKYENGMLIINEGNFTASNGEVSFWRKADNTITNNIFEIENGRPLACIIQDAEVYQNRIYLVGNRADKVEVVNAANFQSVGAITTNLTNPISFAAVGNKGYIMNWGAFDSNFNTPNPFIVVIDLNNLSILKTIALNQRPQGSLAFGKKIYIAYTTSNTVGVLNTDNDTFETAINVSNQPNQMVLDRNNKIWVLCSSGAWVRINPTNNSVEATITNVSTSGYGEKIAINPDKNRLYWLAAAPFPSSNVRVFAMNIDETNAPTTPLFQRNNLYGIGVNALNQIIVGDSKAFQAAGVIIKYDQNNNLIEEQAVGIAPSLFLNR